MEVLMWYLLFAVTTSAAAMYELIIPVMDELRIHNPESNILEYKWVCYFTFFVVGITLAPLVFPSCIVPSFANRFRVTLLTSLSQN